ncbi:MAG: hypothetical protein QW272_07750 [Candidatus Methanomethylicaceae archaeon]
MKGAECVCVATTITLSDGILIVFITLFVISFENFKSGANKSNEINIH